MANSIFISYRRADSQHAAFAVADRLRWAFGPDQVFLDRGSISAGSEWPESLRLGLEAAQVFVVIIGETWLRSADRWGRRRIDDPNDWVRREISTALAAHKTRDTVIIPVLLSGADALHEDAFDEPLKRIAAFQPQILDDNNWEEGLEKLIVEIARKPGFHRLVPTGDRHPNGSPARPLKKQDKQSIMPDGEIHKALQRLGRWELEWAPHPWGIGGRAQQISRSFDFSSFADVVSFMADSSAQIDRWRPPHHPRWENQWKELNVSFTTWDVDCRVTRLDIDAATKFDELYRKWTPHSSK